MADNKFLDQEGLRIVWDQIKLKFADKLDLTELESELKQLISQQGTEADEKIENIQRILQEEYLDKDATQSAINQAIADLIDGAPEDLNTLKELAEMLKEEGGVIVHLQEQVNANEVAIQANAEAINELQQDSVPALSEDGKYFFANGQAISIADGRNGSVDVTYFSGTKYATINVPNANQVTFFGAGDGRKKNVEYPSTSIVVNSGTLKNIVGGGLDNCTVGTTSIVVNGGKVTATMGGGFGDNASPDNGAGNVGRAITTINGGEILMVYGGGQNITNTAEVEVEVYAGQISYLTTGGSNGSTGIGSVKVYGGNIDVWQAGNRGTVENSTMILNGGAINKMYCVGETEDATVTVHVAYSTVSIQHGTVNTLRLGNDTKGGHATSGTVKGEYRDGIVSNDPDDILKTFSKITDTELEAMTEAEILDICK